MMVSSTLYSKKKLFNWLVGFIATLWCWTLPVTCLAQNVVSPELKFERNEEGWWLSTALKFELPAVVEDALYKGIPVHFVAEVDVVRERWYWFSQKINHVQRFLRLTYQPLTRRWRLNVNTGVVVDSDTEQGLTLNQNFENLQDALGAVQRVSHWRIADANQLEAGVKYGVEFRFKLDVSQLPRPLQIGTLGQSDWQIYLSSAKVLPGDLRQ